MKKLSLFLSAMFISIMSFAGTVTFEIGQDKLEGHTQGTAAVLTKDGVTLDVSKGAFGRDDNFRIYAGYGMTISCEYGNITGVEITCTTEQYAPSNLTTTVGTFTSEGLVGTWTGDEASVAFSAAKQVRFTKLVVTYASSDANFVSQPMITGDVNFADTANVVITADEGMKIYYTLDGTDPTTASTEYTVPFQVYATTTVKAIAYNEATATSSLITETVFTQATKVPCAQAAAIAKALSNNTETTELYYSVKGYVTSLKDTFDTTTSKQQFWIADTKTGGEVLYAYNNQVPCAMEVGMKVRIVGRLKQWNTGQYIQPQIVSAKITVLAPAPKIYTVSATAENGTVEGAGQYEEGAQATLTATAAEGYEFVNWTVDGTEVSTENPYTFNVTADVALVANFQEAAAVVTKEEKSTCVPGTLADGKVTHDLPCCVIVQEQGESTTALKSVSPWEVPSNSIMTITPKEGVTILKYVINTKNTTLGTYLGKSELTNATKTATSNGLVTFTVTNGTEPVVMKFVSVTNKFHEITFTYTVAGATEPVKYTVSVKAENGTVEGAGEYEEGAEATLTATANEGYEFVNWTVEGTEVSTKNPYKFNVTANVEVVANFKEAAVVEPTTETVYFINHKAWSKVNTYAWDPTQNANWPGKAATKEAEQVAGYDVYSYTVQAGAHKNVIFNNGSGAQTADLKWTDGKYYWMGNAKNFAGATKEEAEAALAKPIEYEYVYFVDNQGWGKANIYTWTPEVATWPGVAMTKEAEQLAGYDVYSYKVEKGTSFGGMLFNNNNGGKQTADLQWTAGKYYWMGVEKNFAGATKEEAIEKLSAPVTPPVITYVLMGVKGDWTTGIAMTVNPDNENEYVLLGQEIAVGDSVKVVTLTDGVATAWCGNVDKASTVEYTNAEGNGNIVLAPGKYDFYFKVKEDLIYIGAVEPAKPEVVTEMVGVVKRAIQNGDNTIVLTHEADGTAHIYELANGTILELVQEGIIPVDTTNLGDYLAISDIALTEDGKLVARNYMRVTNLNYTPDAGYERGENRFYIWNDLAGAPSVWFTSLMTSNSIRSDQGITMAVKGTSTNAKVLTTGVHNSGRGIRMSLFTIKDGKYVDPNGGAGNKSEYYWYLDSHFKSDAVYNEAAHGVLPELNASPLAANNWIMDNVGMAPSEFSEPADGGGDPIVNTVLADDVVGKKFNGATYLTIGEQVIMVAPYANAEGLLAGVKVLDITDGLATAEELVVVDLENPVAATAAATAVKVVDDENIAITLIADATIYNLTASLKKEIEWIVMEDEINNLTLDLETQIFVGGPSTKYAIAVVLGLGEDKGDGTYTFSSESTIAIQGTDATFIEGYAYEIDPYVPSAKAVIRAELDNKYYEIQLTMKAAPIEPTVIVVENAKIDVEKVLLFDDTYDYSLKMTGNWTDAAGVTYPVLVEVPVYYPEATEPFEMMSTVTVGGMGDNDPWLGFGEGILTISTENRVVTAKGVVENPMARVAFDITISGERIISALEDINTAVAPVKMIKNGQLIINKGGVEYNAQGAVIK